MSKYIIDGVQMTSLADAVRSATGTSNTYSFDGIVSAMSTIGGAGPFDLVSYMNGTLTEVNDIQGDISILYRYQYPSGYYSNLMSANISQNYIAFLGQSSLSYINIPGCKTMSLNAINNCKNLSEIQAITCTSVGNNAINHLPNLRRLNLPSCESFGTQYSLDWTQIDLSINSNITKFYAQSASYTVSYNNNRYISANGNSYYICVSASGNQLLQGCEIIAGGALQFLSNSYTQLNGPGVRIVCDSACAGWSAYNSYYYGTNNNTKMGYIYLSICSYVGNYAFSMGTPSWLKYLSAPNLKYIGNNAFQSAPLTTINIHSQPEYIGHYAFNSATSWNILSLDFTNCSFIGAGAFSGNTTVTECPSTITSNMSWCGFAYYLPNLTTYNCNAGGFVSIRGCSQLSEINLPYATSCELNNLVALETFSTNELTELSITGCNALTTISINACSKSLYIQQCGALTTLSLSRVGSISAIQCSQLSEITCYDASMFYFAGLSGLISLNMPDALSINNFALSNCYNLVDLSLPKLKYISGSYVFQSCSALTYIDLPALESISCWQYIIINCSLVSYINMPSLKNIWMGGYSMIGQMNSLSSVNMDGLERISGRGTLFYNCPLLTQLNFSNLKSFDVGSQILAYNSPVSTVRLYANMEYMGSWLFNGMTSLRSVYLYMSSIPSISFGTTYLFQNTPITNSTYLGTFGSIYVPASLYSEYRTHSQWKTWSSRFASIPE